MPLQLLPLMVGSLYRLPEDIEPQRFEGTCRLMARMTIFLEFETLQLVNSCQAMQMSFDGAHSQNRRIHMGQTPLFVNNRGMAVEMPFSLEFQIWYGLEGAPRQVPPQIAYASSDSEEAYSSDNDEESNPSDDL